MLKWLVWMFIVVWLVGKFLSSVFSDNLIIMIVDVLSGLRKLVDSLIVR